MNWMTIFKLVLQIVPVVEGVFGKGRGKEKRDAAIKLIVPGVRVAEAATGKELVDEDKLAETVGNVVDGVVSILNKEGELPK